jgi:hypothetical protein
VYILQFDLVVKRMKATFEARAIGLLSLGIVALLAIVTILALVNDKHPAADVCSEESKRCMNVCFDNMGMFAEWNSTVDSANANNSLVACLNQCPHADSCQPSNLIRFFPEPVEDKEIAEVKYRDAMDLIDHYLKQENISIPRDIDDREYQEFVKSLAALLDEFADEERAIVAEFAQFVDLYENIAQNQKLKKYQEKMEKDPNSLAEEELIDLYERMPDTDLNFTEDALSNVSIRETGPQVMATVYGNGYNPTKARDYAYKWCDEKKKLRNPKYSKYYADYHKCKDCWNDCTNFVSQTLAEGGMRQSRQDLPGPDYIYPSNWYYGGGTRSNRPSWTWGGARDFYHHWVLRTIPVEIKKGYKSTSLKVGDAVSVDWRRDGDKDHTAIVTKVEKGRPYVTYHTVDRKDVELSKWFGQNPKAKIIGWPMGEAKN